MPASTGTAHQQDSITTARHAYPDTSGRTHCAETFQHVAATVTTFRCDSLDSGPSLRCAQVYSTQARSRV